MSELRFDRQQARQIASFLQDELLGRAETFRLMSDTLPDCLDLTAYDADGNEITHIHPRPYDYWGKNRKNPILADGE